LDINTGWMMQAITAKCDTCDLPLFQQAQLYMARCLGEPADRRCLRRRHRRRLCGVAVADGTASP
jgi:hypothetical protein